jgi:hypothetical protein
MLLWEQEAAPATAFCRVTRQRPILDEPVDRRLPRRVCGALRLRLVSFDKGFSRFEGLNAPTLKS